MRTIDRTTARFVTAVRVALLSAQVQVCRLRRPHGRSNYVYIDIPGLSRRKVRISDHPVGMRRALHGEEDLLMGHRARADSWAVWLGRLRMART